MSISRTSSEDNFSEIIDVVIIIKFIKEKLKVEKEKDENLKNNLRLLALIYFLDNVILLYEFLDKYEFFTHPFQTPFETIESLFDIYVDGISRENNNKNNIFYCFHLYIISQHIGNNKFLLLMNFFLIFLKKKSKEDSSIKSIYIDLYLNFHNIFLFIALKNFFDKNPDELTSFCIDSNKFINDQYTKYESSNNSIYDNLFKLIERISNITIFISKEEKIDEIEGNGDVQLDKNCIYFIEGDCESVD
jgi:hypothetical protein